MGSLKQYKTVFKLLLFLLLLLWCCGIFVLVFFPALFEYFPFLAKSYSIVCHQKEEKLIFINNIPLLVCSRCTGIYIGSLAASFIVLFFNKAFKKAKKLFLVCGSFILADVIINNIMHFEMYKLRAFFTGFIFGISIIIFIISIFEDQFVENFQEK